MTKFTIGSEEHKKAFCRSFIDTHDAWEPQSLPWPDLKQDALARLRAMPFWDEAISTEAEVAHKVAALVPLQRDPILREAVELQGLEEARHSELLKTMLERYDIPQPPIRPPKLHSDPDWGFLRMGYGECFDSFFAFGLFPLARQARLFPLPLLELLEPIVDEEARHILFFANWVAYCRARMPWYQRPLHRARCAAAMAIQVGGRARTAIDAARGSSNHSSDDDFMIGVQDALDLDFTPREVVETCLIENDSRLRSYDGRLLRPTFVPTLARILRQALPRK